VCINKTKQGTDYYKGRTVIDIRVWYCPAGGDWTPSKKGITFDADKLPEVLSGKIEAMEASNSIISKRAHFYIKGRVTPAFLLPVFGVFYFKLRHECPMGVL
jgi:hypothetical protein